MMTPLVEIWMKTPLIELLTKIMEPVLLSGTVTLETLSVTILLIETKQLQRRKSISLIQLQINICRKGPGEKKLTRKRTMSKKQMIRISMIVRLTTSVKKRLLCQIKMKRKQQMAHLKRTNRLMIAKPLTSKAIKNPSLKISKATKIKMMTWRIR